jgi:ubiquinone/menaquinone biosynthesis C-methylase UbiE
MALSFKVRDALKPRENIIREVELKNGFHVLDYGCGPGGYVIAVSKAIGSSGKLYALDINPAAIEMITGIVKKNGLTNVTTILSNCSTGLKDSELDAVLLYDVFHDLTDQNAVLTELHRILKPAGVLSFSDHHLKEAEITSKIAESGLFKLQKKGKYTYTFRKL